LEAVFARGDRRLSEVIQIAHKKGCKCDGWNDLFSFEKWMEAFKEANIAPDFYVYRQRSTEEVFPWDIIDPGIDKDFLLRELDKAKRGQTSPDCRLKRCYGCVVKRLKGGGLCEVKNEV